MDDLQAILDASDSDSSEGNSDIITRDDEHGILHHHHHHRTHPSLSSNNNNHNPNRQHHHQQQYSHPTSKTTTQPKSSPFYKLSLLSTNDDNTNNSDLERILLEDDDEDDDDEEDYGDIMPLVHGNLNRLPSSDYSLGASTISTKAPSLDASTISTKVSYLLLPRSQHPQQQYGITPTSIREEEVNGGGGTTIPNVIASPFRSIHSDTTHTHTNIDNNNTDIVNMRSNSPLRNANLTDLPTISTTTNTNTIEQPQPSASNTTTSSILGGRNVVNTLPYPARHNVEDWAVLQSILNEADDDDDDDDDDDNDDAAIDEEDIYNKRTDLGIALGDGGDHKSTSLFSSTNHRRQPSHGSSNDVDKILDSMDSDDTDDDLLNQSGEFDADIKTLEKIVELYSDSGVGGYMNANDPGAVSGVGGTRARGGLGFSSLIHGGVDRSKALDFRSGGGRGTASNNNRRVVSPIKTTITTKSPPKKVMMTGAISRDGSKSPQSPSSLLPPVTSAIRITLYPDTPTTNNNNNPVSPTNTIQTTTTTNTYHHDHNPPSSPLSPSDRTTDAALHRAREYERRLLRPSQRDILSPLTVKRKMKPRIELPTKLRLAAVAQGGGGVGGIGGGGRGLEVGGMGHPRFEFAGIIQAKVLSRISTQLTTNNKPNTSRSSTRPKLTSSSHLKLHNSQHSSQMIGLPTALAISSKFIAIGTQKGVILIFDLFEELRQRLSVPPPKSTAGGLASTLVGSVGVGGSIGADSTHGGGGARGTITTGSVTSLDLSSNGENLIAGYTSGTVVLWDVIKGSVVKETSDLHTSPITSVRFIYSGGLCGDGGGGSAAGVTKVVGGVGGMVATTNGSLSVVSVDAGGLVNKISFSKTMLRWSTYNVDSTCLLDGTAGQILAMHVLPVMSGGGMGGGGGAGGGLRKTGGRRRCYHPSIDRLILVALSSERSSFAIAVEPSVNVLHRWAKPPTERMNIEAFSSSNNTNNNTDGGNDDIPQLFTSPSASKAPEVFLPCLAWGWALVSGGEHTTTPILARAWGCCLQLLRASFPPFDETSSSPNSPTRISGTSTTGSGMNNDDMHWPAFGVHDEFDVSAPIVALEWLGDRSFCYLTLTNEFTVVDSVMMTLTERLDFSGIKLVYAEFALSRRASNNMGGGGSNSSSQQTDTSPGGTGGTGTASITETIKPEPCLGTTFQNSIRSDSNRLFVLCQEELRSISILGIRERITTLEEDGEWLEALAVALDHYESTIKSQEDRKRATPTTTDSYGDDNMMANVDMMSMGWGDAGGRLRITDDEEWIAELLMRYLDFAVENAPEEEVVVVEDTRFHHHQPHLLHSNHNHNNSNDSNNKIKNNNRIDLAQSHFQMLAGVCIEFCITTLRLDILFHQITPRFNTAGHLPIFLDVLEPYILSDRLRILAPEVMVQFVKHCRERSDVASVERCLLHMDVGGMDIDMIVGLLRREGMYSALVHVFTVGLGDYLSPLECLFEAVFDAVDDGEPNGMEEEVGVVKVGVGAGVGRRARKRRLDGRPQSDLERYGYKAILFLRHCFTGKTFPQGESNTITRARLETMHVSLLTFLMQKEYVVSGSVKRSNSGGTDTGGDVVGSTIAGTTRRRRRQMREFPYPYIHALLLVDTKATLDTIDLIFHAEDVRFVKSVDTQMTMEEWHARVDFVPSSRRDRNGDDDENEDRKEDDTTTNNPITDNGVDDNNEDDEDDNRTVCPDRMNFVRILSIVLSSLDPTTNTININTIVGRSKTDHQVSMDAFYDFLSRLLLKSHVRTPSHLTVKILERASSSTRRYHSSANTSTTITTTKTTQHHQWQGQDGDDHHHDREEEIIKLLTVLPRSSYDRMEALRVVEPFGMTRAALILHKGGVTAFVEGGIIGDDSGGVGKKQSGYVSSSKQSTKHFMRVIECYLCDEDANFRLGVFDYIKKECIGGSMAAYAYDSELNHLYNNNDHNINNDSDYDTNDNKISTDNNKPERTVHEVLRNALCHKLSSLVTLSPPLSVRLVSEMYVEDLDLILTFLQSPQDSMVQFKFFHAVVSGDLTRLDPVAGPVLLANFTVDHHQKYLSLMARFHPEMVYRHLISCDNYRVEECLTLCRDYEIADASAYLLERMGNVSSALQLMLQTLEGRMMALKRVVRGLSTAAYESEKDGDGKRRFGLVGRGNEKSSGGGRGGAAAATSLKDSEIEAVRQILTVALDLCERNSGSSPFSSTPPPSPSIPQQQQQQQPQQPQQPQQQSEHGSQLWFNVLDRLINAKGFLRLSREQPEHSTTMLHVLSDLLRITMQRMVSKVSLPDLLRKITADHAGNRLGEFREMMTTLLKTYSSELEVCAGAVEVMQQDVRKMYGRKHDLKVQGANVHRIMGQGLPLPSGTIVPNQTSSFASIINVNCRGGASLMLIDHDIESYFSDENENDKTSSSLLHVNPKKDDDARLSILQTKRQNKKTGRANTRAVFKYTNTMMTTNDKLFAMGKSSDAAFMTREIGMLSDAEHCGRLG